MSVLSDMASEIEAEKKKQQQMRSCPYCNLRFALPTDLAAHLARRHPENSGASEADIAAARRLLGISSCNYCNYTVGHNPDVEHGRFGPVEHGR